jgi:acyl-CoA synthetase (NDP forming)
MSTEAARRTKRAKSSDASRHPLDPIFHPRAVALVGAPSGKSRGGGSSGFLTSLVDLNFQEKHGLYPVNPRADVIAGFKAYPTLLDCPDDVDHVISLIPARAVPVLVDHAIEKGVRSVHFFTAGFSETGDPEMAALEREMVGKLTDAGIRVLGPNCMGLYVPSARLAFMNNFPAEPGNIMFVSQSGANAGDVVRGLGDRGARFSKVISFGNGADLRAHHFFDYAITDDETELVTSYMEGVQDGRRVFATLKALAAVKPVILLKGGLTGAGARAAHSHTGSLAGSTQIFDAMCRQVGAWRAETMDDLQDVSIAVTTRLRDVQGRGVALIGGGGGVAVLSADALAMAGLEVPPTPAATKRRLAEFIPVAGTSVNNPIDTNMGSEDVADRTIQIMGEAKNIDVIITNASFGRWPNGDDVPRDPEGARAKAREQAERLARLQDEAGVPIVVLTRNAPPELVEPFLEEAYRRGLAAFPTIHRAARAISAIVDWRERRKGLPRIF